MQRINLIAFFLLLSFPGYGVINVVTDFGVNNDGSDQTDAILKAVAAAVSKKEPLYFPAGKYGISRPLLKLAPNQPLVIKGDGPGLTELKLLNELSTPLIQIAGNYAGVKNSVALNVWFSISDITLNGGGYKADAFDIRVAGLMRFERLFISQFNGYALRARMFWDSNFTDVHFVKSGDVSRNIPAVSFESLDPADNFSNTNNITFNNCRWESNPYVSMQLTQFSRRIRFMGCKFHGILPKAAPFDHLQIFESESNVIESTNFTHCGGSALVLRNSKGNAIGLNTINGCSGYGIYMVGSASNVISSNNFAGSGPKNQLGNIMNVDNKPNQMIGNQP